MKAENGNSVQEMLFLAILGSVLASCNVFETKCKETEFAYDLIGMYFDFS